MEYFKYGVGTQVLDFYMVLCIDEYTYMQTILAIWVRGLSQSALESHNGIHNWFDSQGERSFQPWNAIGIYPALQGLWAEQIYNQLGFENPTVAGRSLGTSLLQLLDDSSPQSLENINIKGKPGKVK